MLKRALLALALLGVAAPAFAQNPYRTEQVRLAKGASSATMIGSIRADGGVSYALTVRAGQTMKVSMRTGAVPARFNIIAPGVDEPLFSGSTARPYTGKTPVAGPYKIVVYMMEAAAMRDETVDYALTIGVTN